MTAKNIHETRGTLENGTPPREVEEGGGGTDRKGKLWTRLRTMSTIVRNAQKNPREQLRSRACLNIARYM